MVVVGEYLFAENFITGALTIGLTGKLTGRQPGRGRLLLGATMCGLESFMIFVPLPGAAGMAARCALALLNVAAVFGRKALAKNTAVFMAVSVLSGGASMAALTWSKKPSVTHGGVIYADAVTYLRLLCVGVLAFGFAYWFIKLIRKRKCDLAAAGRVRMTIDEKSYDFNGFVDSGNALTEPISGKPVVLIGRDGAARLPFGASDLEARYGLIPYRSVGVKHGFLEGIRSDSVAFERKRIDGAWVAFYDGCFDDFEVLVGPDFLEGGSLWDV